MLVFYLIYLIFHISLKMKHFHLRLAKHGQPEFKQYFNYLFVKKSEPGFVY